MTIGDNIREQRERLGLTQLELAQKMGLKDKASVCKVENSGNTANMKTVLRYAKALGVSPDSLIKNNAGLSMNMKCPETARRLRQAMEAETISQSELSIRSGVREASISQYVHGSHSPSQGAAEAIGRVLGVSPLWLMGLDVPMNQDAAILTELCDKLSSESRKFLIDLAEFLTNKEKKE